MSLTTSSLDFTMRLNTPVPPSAACAAFTNELPDPNTTVVPEPAVIGLNVADDSTVAAKSPPAVVQDVPVDELFQLTEFGSNPPVSAWTLNVWLPDVPSGSLGARKTRDSVTLVIVAPAGTAPLVVKLYASTDLST